MKATNIIKKLFLKEFNPGGNAEDWSNVKKKWIDLVNKNISKKNNVINIFVENHIETMPNDF